MTPDELVQEFGAAIDARQAGLLVGAGLSRDAGYPLWGSLVRGAAQRAGLAGSGGDLPLLAQYVQNRPDGERMLLDEIVQRIASVEPIPQDSHRLLTKLPVDDAWTTGCVNSRWPH